jgi:outer membrane lipoprotein LolB
MKKSLILFLFTCLLAGCAQTPMPQNIPWQAHQQKLEDLNSWSFSGKIAVITPQERQSLNIYWQQSYNDFHITLTTFLGGTVLELQKTQDITQIIDNEGKHFYGEDTEILIKQLSGFVIPINGLQQWIKGNPEKASYQLNSDNQVASLAGVDSKGAPWTINYSHYEYLQGIVLPDKLQLKHEDIRLKFSISQWDVE